MADSSSSLLIRNGCVVDTEPVPTVQWPADVLIEADRIVAVGANLPDVPGARVLDATDRIVLPGFVDTHRHTWQAALRTFAPDTTLDAYLRRVVFGVAQAYRAEDVYLANLAGALECLDAGITTLVDWFAQVHHSADHLVAAVDALSYAGIRGIVGCAATSVGAFPASGLLRPAVAALGPEYGEPADVLADWTAARTGGCLVTVHVGGGGAESAQRGIDVLRSLNLLGPDTLYVHGNALSDEAFGLIAESGGTLSVTPTIEAAMDHGYPVTGRARAAGVPVGLGVDVVTSGPGDLFSAMRAGYALDRARGGDLTAPDVLRMATLDGARAVGLGDVVGSLRPGKQADLQLLRTDTLGMAATHDPIASVVLSADTSVVDTVLVGGRIVKQDGRLLDHDVPKLVADLRESGRYLTHPRTGRSS